MHLLPKSTDWPRCPCAHCEEAQLRQQEEPGLELASTIRSAFAFRRSGHRALDVQRGVHWWLTRALYLTFVWSCFVLSADAGTTHLARYTPSVFILFPGFLGLAAEFVDPGACEADDFDEFEGANSVDRMDTRYLVVWHAVLTIAAVFDFNHLWTGMHVYMATLTVFIMLYPVRLSQLGIKDGSGGEAFLRMLCHVILGMMFSASLAIFLSCVNLGFFEGHSIQEGLVVGVGNGTAVFM